MLTLSKKVLHVTFFAAAVVSAVAILNYCAWYYTSLNEFTARVSFSYSANILGFALFYAGVIVGVATAFLADVKTFFYKSSATLGMFFFFAVIWLFVNETTTLNLFFYYELFLLPSFFMVYFLSPNRRSILASIYFLTWTQFGSLLVLVGVLRLYSLHGVYSIDSAIQVNDWFTSALIFFGFGIKIPMWPFYYWLTKTHVEASSFFSIYLSGFLVKTAVYLFLKFYSILSAHLFGNLFLTLFVIGVVDSSIKMWHQTDLKKLIAYTTVQEMNFLIIPALDNTVEGETLVALFIVTHCVLSSLLFFYIDVITKRFGTRATTQISGLCHTMPTFSALLFCVWLGFTGLPYTIKFTLELSIFNSLMRSNFLLFLVTIFGMNVIGMIGFSKNFFNAMFGAPVLNQPPVLDLSKREVLFMGALLVNLILLNLLTLL